MQKLKIWVLWNLWNGMKRAAHMKLDRSGAFSQGRVKCQINVWKISRLLKKIECWINSMRHLLRVMHIHSIRLLQDFYLLLFIILLYLCWALQYIGGKPGTWGHSERGANPSQSTIAHTHTSFHTLQTIKTCQSDHNTCLCKGSTSKIGQGYTKYREKTGRWRKSNPPTPEVQVKHVSITSDISKK